MQELQYPVEGMVDCRLLPIIGANYYPACTGIRDDAQDESACTLSKSYASYTYRLLKQKSTIGINKQALLCIDKYQAVLQESVCTAIVHLLHDIKKVTVQKSHICTVTRVLIANPMLASIESKLKCLEDLPTSERVVPCRATLAEQYGLVFPPTRFRAMLIRLGEHVKWRVSVASSIAAALIIQTFTERILDTAIILCVDARKRRITTEHVMDALRTPRKKGLLFLNSL